MDQEVGHHSKGLSVLRGDVELSCDSSKVLYDLSSSFTVGHHVVVLLDVGGLSLRDVDGMSLPQVLVLDQEGTFQAFKYEVVVILLLDSTLDLSHRGSDYVALVLLRVLKDFHLLELRRGAILRLSV